ncbi:MAG: hypothetical protein HOV81_21835 [Kofleriaceae bacterium]|nr:hypothetical protein [Kofleriaceae bacterium]
MPSLALITVGLVAGTGYAIAFSRRGKVATTSMSGRYIELRTSGDPEAVFASILAIGSPYQVDDADRDKRIAVLSTPPSIWNFGFFFPIIVHPATPDDGSRIEVRVRSRAFHAGTKAARALVGCARAIEQLMTVPTARQIERP